jgi:hypothetical protein
MSDVPRIGTMEVGMEIQLACCASLDVHKDSVEVCVREVEQGHRLVQQTRRCATTTRQLLEMAGWPGNSECLATESNL